MNFLQATGDLESVAKLIHLAVAPIFLLTAVSTTLTVLINRLARIVDRGRALESRDPDPSPHRGEIALLERRARLIYRAMAFGVLAAILVCLLMSLAFLGELASVNSARALALLFVGALLSYTGALMMLLREVFLAVGSFRLGMSAPAKR